MALLKKLSLNILSIVILLIFLFGLVVFYIFKAEPLPNDKINEFNYLMSALDKNVQIMK